jgi:hypothetical protein
MLGFHRVLTMKVNETITKSLAEKQVQRAIASKLQGSAQGLSRGGARMPRQPVFFGSAKMTLAFNHCLYLTAAASKGWVIRMLTPDLFSTTM